MLDIGFWELVIIAVLGVVVVGPEKLPGVVRNLMRTGRKLRRMFDEVRSDIERELDLDEMPRLLEENEVAASLRTFKDSFEAMDRDLRAGSETFLERAEKEISGREDSPTFAEKRSPARKNPSRPGETTAIGASGREEEEGSADAAVLDGETYRDTGIEPPVVDDESKAP